MEWKYSDFVWYSGDWAVYTNNHGVDWIPAVRSRVMFTGGFGLPQSAVVMPIGREIGGLDEMQAHCEAMAERLLKHEESPLEYMASIDVATCTAREYWAFMGASEIMRNVSDLCAMDKREGRATRPPPTWLPCVPVGGDDG